VIVNCTFSDNTTQAGTGGAGGQQTGVGDPGRTGDAGFSSGAAVYGRSGQVTLANNILANSKVTVGGSVTDSGGNLSTDLNLLLTNPASMRLVNPLLSGLASNGGPTQTMAIATNSPAINAAALGFCPAIDQRWSNRVDTCDIGAYETGIAQTDEPLPDIPADVINGLRIGSLANQATLSWLTGYTNVFLQFTTNLLSTDTAWLLAPQTPSTNSGSNSVTIDTTSATYPRVFFRLIGIRNLLDTNLVFNSGGSSATNSEPPTP
jgi:hypothetical protein